MRFDLWQPRRKTSQRWCYRGGSRRRSHGHKIAHTCAQKGVEGCPTQDSSARIALLPRPHSRTLKTPSFRPHEANRSMAAAASTGPSPIASLLGSTLVDSAGKSYDTDAKLAGKDTIVIYFSAHCENDCVFCPVWPVKNTRKTVAVARSK